MFKRRPRGWLETISHSIYPRGGWWRATLYVLHRLRRLPDPPHRIARGVWVGTFISFTPFFGMHFLLAALLAWAVGGNVLAALLATFVGNPVTFPLIATISLELGSWMLGLPGGFEFSHVIVAFHDAAGELWHNLRAVFTGDTARWDGLREFFHTVFLPYLVGGLVPGIVTATVLYLLTIPAVEAYQRRRRRRLARRFSAVAGGRGDDHGGKG